MKWLLDRIHQRDRKQRDAVAEEVTLAPEAPAETGPRLALLVHDASAPSSYQLHTFPDAQSAEEFIQLWFPTTADHGLLAFWALHDEPETNEGERPAEAIILIRDEARPEIVYPFSLPDMELARAWLAKEQSRGLNFECVLLHWAAPASIERDHVGEPRLKPSTPPATRGPIFSRPTVAVRKNGVAEEPRNAESEPAADEQRPSHPVCLELPDQLVEAAPPELQDEVQANEEQPAPAEAEVEVPEPSAAEQPQEEAKDDEEQPAPAEVEVEVPEPSADEQPQDRLRDDEEQPAPAEVEVEVPEPSADEQPQDRLRDDEEQPAPTETATPERSDNKQPRPQKPDVADRIIQDALGGSWRSGQRRFEQQEGPFRGFGSPRGKF